MDKQFPASIEKLYEMLDYIKTYANELGFKQDTVKNIELVSEEALINVIVHGYKQKSGGNISIELQTTKVQGIEIKIKDDGHPFSGDSYNSALSPIQRTENPTGEDVGGWGLFLIFKMMDKVEYTQDPQGKNILRLEKNPDEKKD